MCGKLRASLGLELSPRRSGADAEPRPPARPPVHTQLDKPVLEGAYWQELVTVCEVARAFRGLVRSRVVGARRG